MSYEYFGQVSNVPVFFDTENSSIDNTAISGLLENGLQVIIVNELFFKSFNDMEQKFILNHEIGHIVNGHLLHLNQNAETTAKYELVADLYAIKHTTKGIEILKSICSKVGDMERYNKVSNAKDQNKIKLGALIKKMKKVKTAIIF